MVLVSQVLVLFFQSLICMEILSFRLNIIWQWTYNCFKTWKPQSLIKSNLKSGVSAFCWMDMISVGLISCRKMQ